MSGFFSRIHLLSWSSLLIVGFWLVTGSYAEETNSNSGQRSAIAAAKPTIEYMVDLSDAKNHYLTISMEIQTTGKSTELMMAVWTPGSYLVREFARHLDSMKVVDADNQQLEFSKTKKKSLARPPR